MQGELVNQNETQIEDFSLFEHITSWFDREGMSYEADQDRGYVETHISSSAGRWAVVIEIDEYHEQLFFFSQLDIRAPENRRQVVMEFMTRANNGMRLGHFELDLDEGDMCFKIGMQVGELAPSDVYVRNAIGSVVSVMTQYFHGLMAELYTGRDPKEAIGIPTCKAEAEFDVPVTESFGDANLGSWQEENSPFTDAFIFYWNVPKDDETEDLDFTFGYNQGVECTLIEGESDSGRLVR